MSEEGSGMLRGCLAGAASGTGTILRSERERVERESEDESDNEKEIFQQRTRFFIPQQKVCRVFEYYSSRIGSNAAQGQT